MLFKDAKDALSLHVNKLKKRGSVFADTMDSGGMQSPAAKSEQKVYLVACMDRDLSASVRHDIACHHRAILLVNNNNPRAYLAAFVVVAFVLSISDATLSVTPPRCIRLS